MKTRSKLRLILIGLLPLACVVSGETENAAALVQQGRVAAIRGQLTLALESYQQALALDRENAEAHGEIGRLYAQEGDFKQAAMQFEDAVRIRPSWAQAHLDLGLNYVADARGERDWPSAATEFRKAVSLQPGNATAWRLLGVALRETGSLKESQDCLGKAVSREPSAETFFQLGLTYAAEGKNDQARVAYEQAVKVNPQHTAAALALAKVLIEMGGVGQSTQAEVLARRVIRINPDLADAHYLLGTALGKTGQVAARTREWQVSRMLNARQQQALRSSELSNRGLQQAAAGDLPAAVASLREAVVMKPDYAVAHFNWGLVLADSGERSQAIREVAQAISLRPLEGRFDRSLRRMTPDADSVDRAEADTADAHTAFAARLLKQDDTLGASGELLRALEIEPGNRAAREMLALAYQAQGKMEESELERYLLSELR